MAIDEALDELDRPRPGGEHRPGVVLTFDDGTADWVDHVLPALVEHQLPATFYVATAHVESGAAMAGAPAVSWSGLGEMTSTGLVTLGSHTHTHRLLDRVDGAVAASELDRSVGLVEERVGVPCRHFAYPKALLGTPAAQQEVRRRFISAALASGGRNPWAGTDRYRLARSPVQVADGMPWFRRKAVGGLRAEAWLRQALGRRRYANLTT